MVEIFEISQRILKGEIQHFNFVSLSFPDFGRESPRIGCWSWLICAYDISVANQPRDLKLGSMVENTHIYMHDKFQVV